MAEQDEAKHQFVKDNVFFSQMLDLIPPNFYFDLRTQKYLNDDSGESSTEESESTSKEGKKTKKINDAKKAKAKKLASFDPDRIRTVTSVTEMIATKKEEKDIGLKRKKSSEIKNAKTAKSLQKKAAEQELLQKKLSAPANTHEELLERLRAKIDLLKAKRKALGRQDDIQKKRLKRQESKAKLKMRKKQDKKHDKGPPNGMLTPKPKKPVPKQPVFNKEGDMVFSKFDFMEKKEKTEKKNYKKLLEKAQQSKERLSALGKEDSTKAEKVKLKQQWQSVLQKAEGVKVKDNPELIKKTMKKHEKRREKSKKDWKERGEKVEKKMKQRQEKRQTNIRKKKDSRINNKIAKSKKKGRIPGF